MDEIKNHVYTKPALRKLRPLLHTWFEVVTRYQKTVPGDVCWIYNERATLSTLAGAAWLEGWVALEEFSTIKHKVSDEGEKTSKKGRCDLWLKHGTTSFAIEAKQSWQKIGDQVKKDNAGLTKKYDSACSDAAKLRLSEADIRLGLLFIAPSFPSRQLSSGPGRSADENSTAIINKWINTVKQNKLGYDAIAYTFPAKSRLFDLDGRIYPGVALIAKQRQRAVKAGGAGKT